MVRLWNSSYNWSTGWIFKTPNYATSGQDIASTRHVGRPWYGKYGYVKMKFFYEVYSFKNWVCLNLMQVYQHQLSCLDLSCAQAAQHCHVNCSLIDVIDHTAFLSCVELFQLLGSMTHIVACYCVAHCVWKVLRLTSCCIGLLSVSSNHNLVVWEGCHWPQTPSFFACHCGVSLGPLWHLRFLIPPDLLSD